MKFTIGGIRKAMNTKKLLDSALVRLDQVGYRLDDYGISSNVNRHTLIAYLMGEQKRLEGELDSLKARLGARRAQVEHLIGKVEQTTRSGVDLALRPARTTLQSMRGLMGRG